MSTTRPITELHTLLKNQDLVLSERLKLAIELHIASLPQNDQPQARQQLPFLVQFGPLVLKHRKDFSLLQRVNPTIRHGGFTEYEKHELYAHFPKENQLLSFDILDDSFPGKEQMHAYHTQSHCGFPCMLKADVGERGVGIYYIAHQEKRDELMDSFAHGTATRNPSTVQTYCDRPEERCLQFYQHPKDGIAIGSLVKRNLPFVVGDGIKSVITLIHGLSLSQTQKEKIVTALEKEEPHLLEYVPHNNEHITVIRKASIDFGTTYTDYTSSLTPKQLSDLHELLHRLLKKLPLLSVGRFDLKAKSLESLLRGEVKIIECNAGGGIPTHVYDESLSITQKYHILEDHFARMKAIALVHKQQRRGAGTHFSAYRNVLKASYVSLKKKGIGIKQDSLSKAQTLSIYNELWQLLRGKK